MKILKYLIVITILTSIGACTEDDVQPTIVSTSDFNTEIITNVMVGDTVGIVPGTSNKGTVTYTIVSQTPQGAFSIGETYGELMVADVSVIEQAVDSQINLEVSVSKDDVRKTAMVVVDVVEGMACSSTDLTIWTGGLSIDEEGSPFPPIVAEGIADDCGILTITVTDFIGFACQNETNVLLRLQPFSEGENSGTVILENQDYNCEPSGIFQIEGQGEYDITTETIILDYIVIFPDNSSIGPFRKIIMPESGNPEGPTDADGDGVLSDTDTDDNDPCLPAQNPGYTGYDQTNAIWSSADCDGDGVANGAELSSGTDPYLDDQAGGGTCESTVETSVWSGDLEAEDVGFGTVLVTGVEGCGELMLIGDPLGFGCIDGPPNLVIVFTPSSDGATDGTVTVASQAYNCFAGEDFSFEGSGTYDEVAGLIVLNYDFADSAGGGFPGTLNITRQ